MCINSLENGIRTFTLTHVHRHGHSHRTRKQCRCETSHRQTSYLSAGSYGTRSAEGNRRITNATTNKAMTNRNKRLCRSAGSEEIPLGLSLEHMVTWRQSFLMFSHLLIVETNHLGKPISSTGSKYLLKRSRYQITHIFTSDGFLWTRQWEFGSDKKHGIYWLAERHLDGIYWLAERHLDPQELCYMKLHKKERK